MLQSVRKLESFRIGATDGEIGNLHDVLFDDEFWTVRYLVVDTGNWLPGRKVVIPPDKVSLRSHKDNVIPVDLTREKIKASPPLEAERPVSRQHQIDLYAYYGWPVYWGGGMGPAAPYPYVPLMGAMTGSEPAALATEEEEPRREDDPHLRSAREVTGYHVEAIDGGIGHVEDFIVDDETWQVRYLIVDTKNWLPGRKVLIAPLWLHRFDWIAQKAYLDLDKEQIRNSPPYEEHVDLTRSREEEIYDYYGKPRYW